MLMYSVDFLCLGKDQFQLNPETASWPRYIFLHFISSKSSKISLFQLYDNYYPMLCRIQESQPTANMGLHWDSLLP